MQVRDTAVQTGWHDPLPGGNASEPDSVSHSAARDARPTPPAALQGLPSTNSPARQPADRTSAQRRQSTRTSTGANDAVPSYARPTLASQSRTTQQAHQIRLRHQRQQSMAAEAREEREDAASLSESRDNRAAPNPLYKSAGTQTGIIPHHDIHNHSIGPGYSHTQIEDVTKTLAQNAYSQLQYFDKAGVKRFVWAPIPTVIVHGKVMFLDPCGNHDHGHDHAHEAGGAGTSSAAQTTTSGGTTPQTHGATHADGRPKIGTSTYYMDEDYRGGKEMTGEAFDRITSTGVQAYNTSVDWQVGKAHAELEREHPEAAKRIYPSITGVNLADANSVHYVLRLKKEFPNRFFMIGEATSYKEFVDKQNANYQHVDFSEHAPLNDLLRFCGRAGMPFLWHCDSSDAERCIKEKIPGQGEHRAGIESMIARHGNTAFVHAHLGGLGKYGPPGDDHEAWLDKMMTKHPNYKADMSWDVVAQNYSPHSPLPDNHPDKAADVAARQARIERLATVIRKHPDNFIMGSDALVTRNPESISATYNLYANRTNGMDPSGKLGLFDYLPPTVLTKVLSGNFEKVLDKAEADGRRYEADQMPGDLHAMQQEIVQNGRTPNVWPEPTPAASTHAATHTTSSTETEGV